jgi:altronate hydrolase
VNEYIKVNPNDNVAVALVTLEAGKEISNNDFSITLKDTIPQGHKFSITPISLEEDIIKYGHPIGLALANIPEGSWVHTHNLKTKLQDLVEYKYEPDFTHMPATTPITFNGYRRGDGKVGIRNDIWIIPTVGCLNNVVTTVRDLSGKHLPKGEHNIDTIAAFPHPYGCSQMGEDQENTRKILANLINHPNAGGVLVMGLGCENTGIDILKEYIGEYDPNRVRFLLAQDVEDEINDGVRIVAELIQYANQNKREPIGCDELIIGTKCGGSDGLSGITANPIVGGFSDMLIEMGGSTILTEVPEMFGAEILLMNRCETYELFEETVSLINDFKNYFKAHDQTIYENPSPGNKEGGISTLEDKSLGCTQKSGLAPVKGVLAYGEPLTKKGLNLLNSPGNDLVAATALAASGAHLVLFTTGRGTPFASPVPTIKISSNTTLAKNKSNWIDFNCGTLVEGEDFEVLTKKLFDYVIELASGKKSKSEELGFHDMAIFKQGVTL